MLALGLTGWLAHMPHRAADIPSRWRDLLKGLLLQDLATSAWIWSRIVLFMRDRGTYLLVMRVARPCVLVALREPKARL
ncbi:hypothetical protein R75465_08635 [Paraburkholderia aspalathi]|nr:hypothetical protein R75465_08635 [Paraburkholderia aspalathi]